MVDRCSSLSTLLYAKAHHKLGLPLAYSSDSTSDELPYWVPSPLAADGVVDAGLLVIPSDKATSDSKFNDTGSGWASPKDYYEYLVSLPSPFKFPIALTFPSLAHRSTPLTSSTAKARPARPR